MKPQSRRRRKQEKFGRWAIWAKQREAEYNLSLEFYFFGQIIKSGKLNIFRRSHLFNIFSTPPGSAKPLVFIAR